MNAKTLAFLTVCLLLASFAASMPCRAQQTIRLEIEDRPLGEALESLMASVDVQLVYSSRLVDGKRSTCRYAGTDSIQAIRCVLFDTGLRAERVRRNQFVIVETEGPASEITERVRGSLSGFVHDAETGEVLPGAHVYLPDVSAVVATNNSGYFSFSSLPVGVYDVRVSFVGYETAHVRHRVDAQPASVLLRPTSIQGATVLVEDAYTTARTLLPGMLAVPVHELEALPSFPGEQDLLQALQWMPGVRKTGEISGGLVIRGGEPDQNLYLLEGAPIYHPWHAFSLISTFQTETFKSVRLYRGAFPAEFGGRLASVLDIQMKDGARTEPRALVGISLVSGRAIVEAPIGSKSSMMISARRSYLDQIVGRVHPVESSDGRRDTLRTGYYFYDVSTKWTYRPSARHQFALSYYEGSDDLDLRLPFDLSLTVGSWLRPADLFFEIVQRWGNRAISARHNFLASRDLFVTSTLYYTAYGARESTFIRPTSTSSVTSDYDVRLDEVGVKVDLDHFQSLSHQVRGGVHLVQRKFESGLLANVRPTPGSADQVEESSRLTGWEAAAYLQDTWTPSSRFLVTIGLRSSYFASGGHLDLSPSVSSSYQLNPRVILRASAGSQVQFLHRLRDRYSFIYDLVSSRWVPSGDHVAPSRSVQISSGASLQATERLSLLADVYFRRSYRILVPEDAFRTKDGLDGPGIELGALLGQYAPADGRAYGVELAMHYEHKLIDLRLSYAGGRSLVHAPAVAEGYRPSRFDVPRTLRAVSTLRPGPWSFALSADVRSGYPYSIPVARYALADPLDDEPVLYLHRPELNNGRLPAYARLDATVGFRFSWLKATWRTQLHLYNVLDRRNVISRTFHPEGTHVEVTDRRGLPILPLLELEVEL